ncbi:MAG TPA: two-component sensor histidine kinase [Clostridiales bacterium]|nr:two-component sensor histidine kinase [Clostridiales bacterium]
MFNSLFNKLTAMFILVTILGFVIMGIMIFMFLGDMVVNEMALNLEKTAQTITDSFLVYDGSQTLYPWLESWFAGTLRSHSQNTQATIWIIDRSGYLWRFDSPDSEYTAMYKVIQEKFERGPTDIRWRLPSDKYYRKIMTGEYDVLREVGDFQGLLGESGQWLTIQKPIVLKPIDGKSVVWGAVFMHKPVPQILASRTYIFQFVFYSSLVALVVCIILLYFITRRMTRPLKEMNHAAQVIAKGEFDQVLDVNSRDEVGQLARTFNAMTSELRNIENHRREFIANVSHELRTPITTIRGFISGILDGTIPAEKQAFYLDIVRTEAERLGRLVTDLLDLSRIESGESRLVMKKVDINEIIRKCIIQLENNITKKRLNIEMIFEAEIMRVRADPDAILRVVFNLLHNAVKFTPEGGNISVFTMYARDGKVEVSVKDNGHGLEPAELERIFERFYKTDRSRSDDRKGTGLGLAIARSILKEHKQDIQVSSTPGKGTTFTFTLERVE